MMSTSMVVVAVAVTIVGITGLRFAGAALPTRETGAGPVPRRRVRLPARRPRIPSVGNVEVAQWCEDVARSLRAGAALVVAIAEATPVAATIRPAIEPMLTALGRGRPLADAVGATDTATLDPASPTGLALTVVRSCADLGGPAAAPLERVATTLRMRSAIADEQRAHSAQAQLSARVLTVVPVALLALLAMTEPNVRGALATPPGYAAVTAGAILNMVGWRWMQRIIGRPR